MKRVLFVSLVAAALAVAGAAYAATVITNAAHPTKLAFAKSALTAKAGKVTLVMPNPAVLPHNIAIRKGIKATSPLIVKGAIVGKGGTSRASAKLNKGKYRFACTVPGHEAGGMWGILTVK